VHPPTEVGLHFRDILGEVNQHVAAAVDRVSYMVAGIPTIIKNALPARDLRGDSSQAP
jgi:adenosyl cobinamide kinase/adenosyl cobinamide phosphate guanylyltransferase